MFQIYAPISAGALGNVPTCWHRVGREMPIPGMARDADAVGELSLHFCVDELGGHVFSPNLEGVDISSGRKSHFLFAGRFRGDPSQYRNQEMKLVQLKSPLSESRSPFGFVLGNWKEEGTVDVFYAQGSRFGVRSGSWTVTHLERESLMIDAGGPPVLMSDAISSVKRAGLGFLYPNGKPEIDHVPSAMRDEAWASNAARVKDSKAHLVCFVQGKNRTIRLSLPSWISSYEGIYRGIDWTRRHLFMVVNGGDDRDVLQVTFGDAFPLIKRLSIPSSYRRLVQKTSAATRLVNGDIALPCRLPPHESRLWTPSLKGLLKRTFGTLLYSARKQEWELYDGVGFVGASANGKYVAYVTGKPPMMRVARVDQH